MLKALREAVGKAEVDGTTLAYVAKLACPLIDRKIFDKGDWVEVQPVSLASIASSGYGKACCFSCSWRALLLSADCGTRLAAKTAWLTGC